MRFLLVKATAGRKYQCIDCDGEDPMRSPDVSKLLQGVRPPENNTPLSGFAMKHRGIEYTLVRGGGAGVWKWSASVAGVAIMGIATNKSEAVAGQRRLSIVFSPSKVRLERPRYPTGSVNQIGAAPDAARYSIARYCSARRRRSRVE
jgi:hypothetical protein